MAMRDKAEEFGASEYWRERFAQFNLQQMIDNYPQTPEQVYSVLMVLQDQMRVHFQDWLDVDYGALPAAYLA